MVVHDGTAVRGEIAVTGDMVPTIVFGFSIQSISRFTGLQFTGLPCLPVFFFRATPSPRFTGVVHFFMLTEPLLLLHTPTYAAARSYRRCLDH